MAMRQVKSDSSRKSLVRIKANAHHITVLAKKLLQLSYSEAYAFEQKDNQTFNLAVIVQECVNAFKELAQRKHFELELEEAFVFGNRILFIELLNNIIDNALKYSDFELSILVETFVDEGRSVLQITDNGPGIPEELRQLVTERFFRASNDTTGSGLGLAIVKEVVLVHHGEMQILGGKEGVGTCIRCSFPCVMQNQR